MASLYYSSIHPLTQLSIHSSIHPSNCLSIHSSIYLSTYLSIHQSIYPPLQPFIQSYICPYIPQSIYQCMHPSIISPIRPHIPIQQFANNISWLLLVYFQTARDENFQVNIYKDIYVKNLDGKVKENEQTVFRCLFSCLQCVAKTFEIFHLC